MAGGNNIRDLIMVPAATWDHNNSHWEFRLAQLKQITKRIGLKRKLNFAGNMTKNFLALAIVKCLSKRK